MVRRRGRSRVSKTPEKVDRLITLPDFKTPEEEDRLNTLPDLKTPEPEKEDRVSTLPDLKTPEPEKEDRLSTLPDSLIHHILSLLPSTKQAVRTSVLSTQWLNQWTSVSNIILDFSGMSSHYSPGNGSLTTAAISRIIDRTLFLHEPPKIQKFHMTLHRFYDYKQDPSFEKNFRFVVRKQAEEIVLKFSGLGEFMLPEFFFVQSSLVKLHLFGCSIGPSVTVDWKSLKDLYIDKCNCACEGFESVVSGSPSLQSLEVKNSSFRWLDRVAAVVAVSKSLKKLVLIDVHCDVDISCPNLVEFYVGCEQGQGFRRCGKLLLKCVSQSPSLESLELENLRFSSLRVASVVLKKLVLSVEVWGGIEISCPYLEEFDLTGCIGTIRLTNLPSSVCARLDFECYKFCEERFAQQMLKQLQHLNELKLGRFFIEFLSKREKDGIYRWNRFFLNCKYLTLEAEFGPCYLHIPGIVYALRTLPLLESLVVKVQPHTYQHRYDRHRLYHPEDKYWSLKKIRLSSSMLHLRTVKITGFSKVEYRWKPVLGFVRFLLKHASALEKLIVVSEDSGTDFVNEVSSDLASFPRCSNAITELVCPE